MRCKRCAKPINPLRQLTDLEFCSESCRKRGPRASASVLRDIEFENDPFWQAQHGQANKQHSKTSGAAMAMMLAGLVGVMVAARVWFPESGAAVGGPSPLARGAPSTQPSVGERPELVRESESGLSNWLQNHLPGDKPVRVAADFSRSNGEWVGSGSGWSVKSGLAYPGKLRLWKPTLETRDYEVEFRATIEKKGLGFAFRARDSKTYYATKILMAKSGDMSGSSILRYGMQNDRIFSRVELPIPIALQRDKKYNITMLAEGNRFTTLIDGKMVDEWTDSRLRAGGVGFFAEEGETAAIEWANFREKKGLLARFLSANIWVPPGMVK